MHLNPSRANIAIWKQECSLPAFCFGGGWGFWALLFSCVTSRQWRLQQEGPLCWALLRAQAAMAGWSFASRGLWVCLMNVPCAAVVSKAANVLSKPGCVWSQLSSRKPRAVAADVVELLKNFLQSKRRWISVQFIWEENTDVNLLWIVLSYDASLGKTRYYEENKLHL